MSEPNYMIIEFCTPFCRANKFADQLGKEADCNNCKRKPMIKYILIHCATCQFNQTCGKSHEKDEPYCPLWKGKEAER